MTQQQVFMRPDGTPIEWLQTEEGGDRPYVAPDIFSGIRVLLAVIDGDTEQLGEILADRPAIPLLGGLATLAQGFGEKLFGEGLRQALDQMALSPDLDPANAADDYRARRTA